MELPNIEEYILDVVDWPKKGIVFKDITPLLESPAIFHYTIDQLTAPFLTSGITKVLSMEARGFIFASAICYKLRAGFVPARKPGKLPRPVISAEYILEYGTDNIEIHTQAITPEDIVLIVDDVLATGGTAAAAAELVRDCGATNAGYAFVMQLDFLKGEEKLDSDIPLHVLLHVAK
ncbi:MAG: adenine phosphoribosyltransferase [Coriobacteriia bacterium]|nr:adenine phosphoribosyltransferase [Coriobacteriia bacterium]